MHSELQALKANGTWSLTPGFSRSNISLMDQLSGEIFPLLKLLKEGASVEARIAAAIALFNIANDKHRVRLIIDALRTSMIVGVLEDSPMKVQISVANFVARMANLDDNGQEEFMRLNVTRPLMSLLSNHLDLEVVNDNPVKTSIPSLVEMNKQLAYKNIKANYNSDSSSHGGSHNKKEREMETPEVQLKVKVKVKVSCAEALWKLSKGSLSNRKRGMQFNCLMTITEITAVAESNADLRHAAFKPNLPGAKVVLDKLLRVIQEESDPKLQIPAIRSIGCLARTFPTRETRIMRPLVSHLGNRNADIATEAAMALGKFACPENFNCSEHSKAIIELDGALNALEGTAQSVLAQHLDLKDLIAKAIHLLILYHVGATLNRQSLAS
uniref:Condensin complex subunit 1 C-terminal domain-containing protein n=1 Tax=Populus trichocarpa TaxID=3694 RepID=A0A2K1YAV1_POPTR